MLATPIISVIIPVYNGEKYIAACLQMMRRQTYQHLEIIVVDDASADGSATIAESYDIKLLRLPDNRGLSVARNTGMDRANGTFIHFMDVDDVINEDFYEKLVAAIVATQAEVACAGMINEKRYHLSMLFKNQKVYTDSYEKLKATYVGKLGYVVRYLFSLDFLRQHNLRFEEGRLIEDLLFSLPAVYFAKALVVVPEAIYTYRHIENSIMTTKDRAHVQKRRADRKHAKRASQQFAREQQIRVPGLNAGVMGYILRKIYRKMAVTLFGKKTIIY